MDPLFISEKKKGKYSKILDLYLKSISVNKQGLFQQTTSPKL